MKFTEFEHNDNWKIKRFPCSCCLVKPACNDYTKCELLEANSQKVYKIIMNERKCPDCGVPISRKESDSDYLFKCPECEHHFKILDNYEMALRGIK